MRQLIFVIYYRDDDGLVEWDYFSVWSSNPSDWEFTVRAWEQLFRAGVFDPYSEIFSARDNGSHFRCYDVLHYESEIGYRHNKTFRVRSYDPNHGYNQCDRHAATVKGAVRQAAVRGQTIHGGKALRRFPKPNQGGYPAKFFAR